MKVGSMSKAPVDNEARVAALDQRLTVILEHNLALPHFSSLSDILPYSELLDNWYQLILR